MERKSNQASKNKVTYLSGKPKKDDKYYNDTQLSCLIYEMANVKGWDETIQYLQNKVNQTKLMKSGK